MHAPADSWKSFCDELQAALLVSETKESLAARFAGRTVEWVGTVRSIAFDHHSNNVEIDLPLANVTLHDGTTVPLDGVCVSVTEADTERWAGIASGDALAFQATFVNLDSVFACCEVKRLRSGPVLVILALGRARPA